MCLFTSQGTVLVYLFNQTCPVAATGQVSKLQELQLGSFKNISLGSTHTSRREREKMSRAVVERQLNGPGRSRTELSATPWT